MENEKTFTTKSWKPRGATMLWDVWGRQGGILKQHPAEDSSWNSLSGKGEEESSKDCWTHRLRTGETSGEDSQGLRGNGKRREGWSAILGLRDELRRHIRGHWPFPEKKGELKGIGGVD